MIIRDQFDPDLRKIIRKKKQIAIIPVGSIEQHGPHLPISTDSDIVTEIALRLSEKINGFLLPTITYGISDEHFPFFNLTFFDNIVFDPVHCESACNIFIIFR